ncbi:hypothetical protein E8D34_18465 [Nocardioides sp. GY 10113]|uniref:DUF6325 family protein n=1 Tax=Nocardioides sp. GY 10113 TaxID=2569761 RepID=UPI0010A8C8F2|nr:DUF6325 family protein [Nocardioides sp. GY 10113]TIC80642.1 hypothetical protein E8D34_18465 [Nocardioides sp. GY 10113]
MSIGPVEVVVLTFPGSRFNGAIIPELERLQEAGTITIVDAVFAHRADDGELTVVELDEDDAASADLAPLANLFEQVEALFSDEDVTSLTEHLEPGSSAALLAFEHTWVKPLRDAVVGSDGELTASIRIPAEAVEEVLDALRATT